MEEEAELMFVGAMWGSCQFGRLVIWYRWWYKNGGRVGCTDGGGGGGGDNF